VPAASQIKFLYFCYFSQPVADRAIYRLVKRLKPSRILELGIGDGSRAKRLIEAAARFRPAAEMRYAGVDLFEARPADSAARGLKLKDAHVLFKQLGVKAQLLPGDPNGALSRSANALRDNDLVLIAEDQNAASLEQAWFYIPRMLHARSVVLRETTDAEGVRSWRVIPRDEIDSFAAAQKVRRRVA
jgi:hypothetical protein